LVTWFRDTSTQLVPPPSWYLHPVGASTQLVPLPSWCLYPVGASTQLVPLPSWCLHPVGASTQLVPLPSWYLWPVGTSIQLVPLPSYAVCLHSHIRQRLAAQYRRHCTSKRPAYNDFQLISSLYVYQRKNEREP
jgi:hypothetical protein